MTFKPPLPLVIRPGRIEDHGTIVQYNLALAWETEQKQLDQHVVAAGVLQVLLGLAEAEYWVAEVDGNVVGQMMLTREWSDWRRGWIYWIQSVYVAEGWRQQGVFSTLFHTVEDTLIKRADTVGCRLYVEQHNMRAQAIYRHLGFQQSGYIVMERIL
ncbi:MAG: hypothetical protein KatS3mg113_0559 [Planctomycetaceae bacterium]|nr:MAG: hypothetical protein KatS3mg113_0559 [Planctomycetaceae bacterium]